jgi:NAD+ kinase
MDKSSTIRAAGILSKPQPSAAEPVIPELLRWLRAHRVEVLLDTQCAERCAPAEKAVAREEIAARADLLIVVGGDGTMLAAARLLDGKQTPILGVNVGGMGFLTSATLEELYPLLENVWQGQHRVSERMMLQAEVARNGQVVQRQRALNDAVVTQAALARLMDFDVTVDQHFLGRYRADGLIVATPTGSTAYSLAAGGPIVLPDLEAFVITPICSHMLTNRPVVVPDAARVEIEFTAGAEPVHLTLDGQVGFALAPGDRVVVSKCECKVRLISPAERSYFQVLRSKLRWSER